MYDKTLKFLVFSVSVVISNPPLTTAAVFYDPNFTPYTLTRKEFDVTAINISHPQGSPYRPRFFYRDFVTPYFTLRTDLETFPQENHSAPSLKELAMLKVLSACPSENFEDYVPSLSKRIPTDLIEEARQFLLPSNSDKLKQYHSRGLLKGAVFNAIKQRIESEAELGGIMICGTNTYSGGTTISAGTLARTGTGTLVLGLHNSAMQEESADMPLE